METKKKNATNLLKENEYLKCIANISEVKKNVFSTNYPEKNLSLL